MRLDRKQRIVVLVGVAILVLMSLLPPWQKRHVVTLLNLSAVREEACDVMWRSAGYSPIFLPPGSDTHGSKYVSGGGARIDLVRLGVQFVAVALGTVGAVWFLRLRREDQAAGKAASEPLNSWVERVEGSQDARTQDTPV
jgi:hypothetical protein